MESKYAWQLLPNWTATFNEVVARLQTGRKENELQYSDSLALINFVKEGEKLCAIEKDVQSRRLMGLVQASMSGKTRLLREVAKL